MNAKTKRLIASWVLLAVFLPMLVFASLHSHPASVVTGDSCTACVNHQCEGHLTQQAASFHACVLCQLLTLPMLGAAACALIIFNKVYKALLPMRHTHVCLAHNAVASLRAPPAFFL